MMQTIVLLFGIISFFLVIKKKIKLIFFENKDCDTLGIGWKYGVPLFHNDKNM